MVDALARAGDFQRAIKTLDEAEELGDARPRRETFNALIKAYRTALIRDIKEMEAQENDNAEEEEVKVAKLGHYLLATRRLLSRMENFGDQRKHPDVITYNTILDICAELGDLRNAKKLYKTMCERNIRPDAKTFNTLIKVCRLIFVSLRLTESVCRSDESDFAHGGQVSNRARTGLMEAFKWTKEMAAHGVKPDQFTYAGLLSASAESKDIPRALDYFQATLLAKQREITGK